MELNADLSLTDILATKLKQHAQPSEFLEFLQASHRSSLFGVIADRRI